MSIVLKPVEGRVLGVLIEKSMAQAAYYPMSLNAITVACNQKNNRDPVRHLTEGEVGAAVHGLQQWQLISLAPPERGTRVNRFCHEVERRLGWNSPQRAIMAELLLRGPQTLGELRSNASRLTHLDATDYIREVLAELEKTDPPQVVELPRQTGQAARRFAQLLTGPVSQETIAAMPSSAPTETPATTEIEDLRREVKELRAEVADLRQRLQAAGLLS